MVDAVDDAVDVVRDDNDNCNHKDDDDDDDDDDADDDDDDDDKNHDKSNASLRVNSLCIKKNKTRNYFESLFVQGIHF